MLEIVSYRLSGTGVWARGIWNCMSPDAAAGP